MKRQLIIALLFLVCPVLASAAPVNGPTAKEVLEKAIQALGGRENLEGIHTRKMSAKVELNGLPGTYEVWSKAPDRYRMILDLVMVRQERVYDGSVAWQRDTSIHELSGLDLQRLKRAALFDPLLQYLQDSVPVELKGEEQIDSRSVYVIQFRLQDSSELFYIDAQSFLPIREVRQVPYKDGPEELKINYADFRKVDQIMLPFSITQILPDQTLSMQIEKYQLNVPMEDSLFVSSAAQHAGEPYEITLATIPLHVYKENDGVWETGSTESWVFNLVVKEKYGRSLQVESATIDLYTEKDQVQSDHFSRAALDAVRGTSFGGLAGQEEVYDLRHYFSESVDLGIDRMVYTLEFSTPEQEKLTKTLEIPVTVYKQKIRLIFPIRGKFMVGGGHDFNEAHKREWSQHYAYDIIRLGPNGELDRNGGKKNEDYYSWGREIVAPADGVVVYCRNDVPDNPTPGQVEMKSFLSLPDPRNAVGGNNVILDHGNGEFSFLAHMQLGSVRVKKGDRVKQGDVLGLLGNSGNSDGPHLHYHLMADAVVFRSDGLPSSFENTYMVSLTTKKIKIPQPKRGIYLEAE